MKEYNQMLENLNDEQRELFVKSKYAYLYGKAVLFLKIGAKKYLEQDFFDIDISDLDDDDFEILKNGCEQILMGRGLSPEKPFENLGVLGFTKLFEIFHFNSSRIETIKSEPMKFLDTMSIEHQVNRTKSTLFNLIEY